MRFLFLLLFFFLLYFLFDATLSTDHPNFLIYVPERSVRIIGENLQEFLNGKLCEYANFEGNDSATQTKVNNLRISILNPELESVKISGVRFEKNKLILEIPPLKAKGHWSYEVDALIKIKDRGQAEAEIGQGYINISRIRKNINQSSTASSKSDFDESSFICSTNVEILSLKFSGARAFLYSMLKPLFNRVIKREIDRSICRRLILILIDYLSDKLRLLENEYFLRLTDDEDREFEKIISLHYDLGDFSPDFDENLLTLKAFGHVEDSGKKFEDAKNGHIENQIVISSRLLKDNAYILHYAMEKQFLISFFEKMLTIIWCVGQKYKLDQMDVKEITGDQNFIQFDDKFDIVIDFPKKSIDISFSNRGQIILLKFRLNIAFYGVNRQNHSILLSSSGLILDYGLSLSMHKNLTLFFKPFKLFKYRFLRQSIADQQKNFDRFDERILKYVEENIISEFFDLIGKNVGLKMMQVLPPNVNMPTHGNFEFDHDTLIYIDGVPTLGYRVSPSYAKDG
uniref:Lipid-binding serum glycoprotein N-terminal domain-containing protein n=1 Tax=Romanomermis culicivorax TaxID=13658 RepID=A0A915IV63_ROMCU